MTSHEKELAVDFLPSLNGFTSAYWRDGFCVLRDFVPQSVIDNCSAASCGLAADSSLVNSGNYRTLFRLGIAGTPVLDQIGPIIDVSACLENFANSTTLRDLAKSCLRNNSVQLFRDKLILKLPGSTGYPAHQDYSWWHDYLPDEMVTIGIALDSFEDLCGPLEFLKKSHYQVLLPIGEWRALHENELAMVRHLEHETIFLKKGDVIAFHPCAVHWSGPNMSGYSRRMLYFSYILGDDREVYDRQFATQFKKYAEVTGVERGFW